MTRIAFLDVDGTITDHGSVIAPSTVDAVRQARANGHLVWLCTGRTEADIHPHVIEIGFDGIISNGGAYATRDGEMLIARPMPRTDAETLETYFRSHGIHYFLQTHDAVHASPGMAETMERFLRARYAQRAEDLAALGLPSDVDHRQRDLRDVADVDRDRVAKAVFVSPSPDTVAHAASALGANFHVIPGSMPLPGGSNGEIGQTGVTKGSAITEVLEVLGLSATDAIGIGDSWNDVEMFEVVGTPVAMGNAEPQLQRLAGRVTSAVLEDGVRNAFAELGLI